MAPGLQVLEIIPTGGRYTGGSLGGDADLYIQVSEYGRTIHYGATYYGPFPGVIEKAGIAGPQ